MHHYTYDIHMSVHCNIIPNYSQQDAMFLDLSIFTGALHVSGGSSAHRQEHITVHTTSGIVNCNDKLRLPILLLAATVDEMECSISSTVAGASSIG
jgi:hypothetical protein